MASLLSLLKDCKVDLIPGMSGTVYVGLFNEMDGFPQTQEAVTLAAAGDPEPGDTKRYGEAITYLPGGFHREIDILVDTATLTDILEGETGGKMNKSTPGFFIPGFTDEVREFIDCLKVNSGCLHIVLKTKTGITISVGTPDYPCWIESYEGGPGGDRVGYQVNFFSSHPDTVRSMDLDAFPLGLAPAA
jgi:hypothetical protein